MLKRIRPKATYSLEKGIKKSPGVTVEAKNEDEPKGKKRIIPRATYSFKIKKGS